MKTKHSIISLFFILLGLIPLSAQPILTGELTIDSVQGYIVEMHLDVTNTGNQTYNYTFGSSEMSFYSIDGMEMHEMALPIVIPFFLDPGASYTFDMINFHPLSSGPHIFQGYLNAPDGTGNTTAIGEPQTVVIAATTPVTIGAGDQLSRIPIDFFWRTTMYECVFTAEELNHTAGWITSLSLYNNFSQQAFLNQDVRIYLARLTQSDLSEDWIGWEDLFQVFYGTVDFPLGSNEVNIPLTSGLYYDGSTNLGLVVHRPIPDSYQYGAETFMVQAVDSLRARKVVSDSQTFSPYYPPDPVPAQNIGYMPKTTFYIIPYSSAIPDENGIPSALISTLYPNPAHSECTIKIQNETPQSAIIDIYNLRGQKVRSFTQTEKSTEHILHWDTKDVDGKPCPSGIYIYRVTSGQNTVNKRLVLLH